MVQQNVKVSESTEVETVEASESIPEVKVEAVVDIGEMMSSLSWKPLENDKLEILGEEILTGLLEKIPGLLVRTSKNQHQAISYGEGRGRTVAKVWFSKKKIVLETAELVGKAYSVKASREISEKNGLSAKDRSKVLAEIRAFVKSRGFE